MDFGGDGAYTTAAIGESRAPPPPLERRTRDGRAPLLRWRVDERSASRTGKLTPGSREVPADSHRHRHASVRAELRRHTHALLVKQGVETDLHVWEGMFHGFFYNVDVPESRDCYDIVVKFFEKHLGGKT